MSKLLYNPIILRAPNRVKELESVNISLIGCFSQASICAEPNKFSYADASPGGWVFVLDITIEVGPRLQSLDDPNGWEGQGTGGKGL